MDEHDGLDLLSGILAMSMLVLGLAGIGMAWYGMYGATVLGWFGK